MDDLFLALMLMVIQQNANFPAIDLHNESLVIPTDCSALFIYLFVYLNPGLCFIIPYKRLMLFTSSRKIEFLTTTLYRKGRAFTYTRTIRSETLLRGSPVSLSLALSISLSPSLPPLYLSPCQLLYLSFSHFFSLLIREIASVSF